jgi:hypothetical protein
VKETINGAAACTPAIKQLQQVFATRGMGQRSVERVLLKGSRGSPDNPLPPKPEFSLVLFPGIQGIEGEENLAGLAPQRRLVPTEAVEREVGQIGKA